MATWAVELVEKIDLRRASALRACRILGSLRLSTPPPRQRRFDLLIRGGLATRPPRRPARRWPTTVPTRPPASRGRRYCPVGHLRRGWPEPAGDGGHHHIHQYPSRSERRGDDGLHPRSCRWPRGHPRCQPALLLFDGLGSVVAVANGNGGVTNSYTYDPFGVTTETKATLTNLSNPWRYTGQYFDIATEMYKMGARYYQPELGRWTQRDPSGLDANAYAYVGGNPVNFVDPTGLFSFGDLAKVAAGAIVGVAAAGIVQGALPPSSPCWHRSLL